MAERDQDVADVCVVGAGPAGSTLAARLAQLGHEVCVVERTVLPSRRLGESLSPGVLPLLEVTGARAAIESAGFRRVGSVQVHWDRGPEERHDPRQQGLLVDRGAFDRLLLERARALGVRVLQPAMLREPRRREDGWELRLEIDGRGIELHTRFLADACGRGAALPGHRRRQGLPTLALYAYWRGPCLPEQPHIEAGADAWYWGVPLPDGSYNTLVFVDPRQFRGVRPAGLARRFHELLDRSGLMRDCRGAHLASPVRAADATPYLDCESVTRWSIKVGDTALALDPLSSSGVQKAIQTALAGAVVVNTILRKPEASEAALEYYRENLRHASERHSRWAAGHYAAVARQQAGTFWSDRAADAGPAPSRELPPRTAAEHGVPNPVELSPQLERIDLPCLEGELVAVKPALRHPGLSEPLVYLGGWDVATLLREVRAGMTPLDLARSWSDRVPPRSGLAIAIWLLDHGLLVERRA